MEERIKEMDRYNSSKHKMINFHDKFSSLENSIDKPAPMSKNK